MSSNFIPATFTGPPPPPPPAPAPSSPYVTHSSSHPSPSLTPSQPGLFADYLNVPVDTSKLDCPSCRFIGGGTSVAIGTYAMIEARKMGAFTGDTPSTKARGLVFAGTLLTIAGFARMAGITTNAYDAPRTKVEGGGGEQTTMLPKGEAGTPGSIKEGGHAVA